MRTVNQLACGTVVSLAAGCSLLFEPEGGGQQCPELVSGVEQLAMAEQLGPGGLTAATYSLPPSCGPWLVALSAQISSTSAEDCTRVASCGLATLSVDRETVSMVEAGPLREGAASWVDTVIVRASAAPTELTIDLLGGARVDVTTQLAQFELVAIPLPGGTAFDVVLGDEFEVDGTDWREAARLDRRSGEGLQLAMATGCGTQAPGFGSIAFQLLVGDSSPWPPMDGPRNGKDPVRCAPLFDELEGGTGIALQAQGGPFNPNGNSRATSVLARLQRLGSPPGTRLLQGQLSSQLLLDTAAPLVSAQLDTGSFLVVATGALNPFNWVQDVSAPRFEMQLALGDEPVQTYESAIVSQANRTAQGFVRRVQGPDTVTLTATVREFQTQETTVYAVWSSLLIIPAP